MTRFEGRNIVITGGSRGIGLSVAERFVEDGASLIITGRGGNSRDAAAALSSKYGTQVESFEGSVDSEEDMAALASHAKDLFGHVDVLVNNAGIAKRNRIEDISLAEWNEVIGVNYTGTFLAVRAMLPLMRGIKGANVVNIASQAGKRGEGFLVHYASSKSAVIGLTKSMALELAPDIRVNAVCPGFIETDMILEHYEKRAAITGQRPEEVKAEMVAKIPLRRMQSADSIANVTAFLASHEAEDMTGQAINVTGGMVME